MGTFLALALFLSLGWVGVSYVMTPHNPDFQPSKSHHRPDGFVNRDGYVKPAPNIARWQWERRRLGLPKPPASPIVGVSPNLSLIHSVHRSPRLTWVGHSTVLYQLDGLNILTDPHFGQWASPIQGLGPKRHQPPGLSLDDLPPIQVVLISHNHYDHLDEPTIQALMTRHPGIRFYVPLGVQYWFKDTIRGTVLSGPSQNVWALDWDDSVTIPGRSAPFSLHFLSVRHWSARGLFDRNATLWGSWAVIHPTFRFWFSGDLAYSPELQSYAKRWGGFDLAAIAIGAYEPRYIMKGSHVNPSEAVQVMRDVKARTAVGIHWGTFEGLTDESLDQPPRDLQKALQTDPLDFRVLAHGQTWEWSAPRR